MAYGSSAIKSIVTGKCDVAAGERTDWSLSHSYTGSRRSQQELGSGYNFSKSTPQWTWPFNKTPFFLKVPQSPPTEPPVFKYLSIWGGGIFHSNLPQSHNESAGHQCSVTFPEWQMCGSERRRMSSYYREHGPRSVLKTILGLDLDPSRWLVPI